MRADREEQLMTDSKASGGFPVFTLLLIVAVLGGSLLFWFWNSQDAEQVIEPEVIRTVVLPEPEPELPPVPDIPLQVAQPPVTVVLDESAEAVPLPQEPAGSAGPDMPIVDPGDALLREQLDQIGADTALDGLRNSEHPMDVSAALIDGMSRGTILRKILPADPPTEAFLAVGEDDALFMSKASYKRYDAYTDTITSLDAGKLIDSFHALRPLYERAYGQLGLEPDEFDNSVIRTLDLILATPEIEGPIALERKKVMYTYEDPALEQLPTLQKQLLRMGPDNIRLIKEQAQSLRDGLLQE